MSKSNGDGVIRVGRKGRKKFAFGEDGEPFEVDVVVAFQEWIGIDDEFRDRTEDRSVAIGDMAEYHRAAVDFVTRLVVGGIEAATETPAEAAQMLMKTLVVTTAEALDFIARLREQYDELADFFQPRPRGERDSPDTSEAVLQFSAEES